MKKLVVLDILLIIGFGFVNASQKVPYAQIQVFAQKYKQLPEAKIPKPGKALEQLLKKAGNGQDSYVYYEDMLHVNLLGTAGCFCHLDNISPKPVIPLENIALILGSQQGLKKG